MTEYIEREALNGALREAVRKYPSTFYNGLETARQIAHDLPAADVRPVVRGKWIDVRYDDEELVGGWYTIPKCSACEEEAPYKSNFCPNCGAKMEEN